MYPNNNLILRVMDAPRQVLMRIGVRYRRSERFVAANCTRARPYKPSERTCDLSYDSLTSAIKMFNNTTTSSAEKITKIAVVKGV
mmetsp:Transcript_56382/g.67571  ORF Transcript_56382/g.67571 Transcript_56382/m.67571 type:complete len:85 (-) Transcript_56382:481-735(-)